MRRLAMRRSALLALVHLLVLGIAAGGCGDEGAGPVTPPPPPPPPWENTTPALYVASPSELAVGDEVTIIGKDFIDALHGRAIVHFTGTFFDESGASHAVDYQAEAELLNPTKLRWRMFPNVVFHPNGDQLGRFVGQVVVINEGNDGSRKASSGLPTAIDILPSILPRMARPSNVGCGRSAVTDTLEDQPMAFTMEVIGLRAGTTDAPLTFHWTFLAEHWNVSFTYGVTDPGSIVPETGALMLTDEVKSGRASVVTDGGDRNMLLKIGEDLIGTARLKTLRTKTLPAEGNNMPINVNVAAVDASGKTARISLRLTIHKMADLHYDGAQRVAERYAAVQVTDCIPGGDIGREVSYHESNSESRSRAMGFNYNAQVGMQMGLPSNPFALGINFSAGFGVNVNETVSSDKSTSLNISGHLLPGLFGAFYRQTTKVERIARLVGWTACGESVNLGEATLTDWIFTPDLASGPTCVPPTNLPAAQKFSY